MCSSVLSRLFWGMSTRANDLVLLKKCQEVTDIAFKYEMSLAWHTMCPLHQSQTLLLPFLDNNTATMQFR